MSIKKFFGEKKTDVRRLSITIITTTLILCILAGISQFRELEGLYPIAIVIIFAFTIGAWAVLMGIFHLVNRLYGPIIKDLNSIDLETLKNDYKNGKSMKYTGMFERLFHAIGLFLLIIGFFIVIFPLIDAFLDIDPYTLTSAYKNKGTALGIGLTVFGLGITIIQSVENSAKENLYKLIDEKDRKKEYEEIIILINNLKNNTDAEQPIKLNQKNNNLAKTKGKGKQSKKGKRKKGRK